MRARAPAYAKPSARQAALDRGVLRELESNVPARYGRFVVPEGLNTGSQASRVRGGGATGSRRSACEGAVKQWEHRDAPRNFCQQGSMLELRSSFTPKSAA